MYRGSNVKNLAPADRKEAKMDDASIVELYFRRSETAIEETSKKYGAYCMKICMNILGDISDSEECVSDTYLNAWNSIPPHRPEALSAFLGRIARNLALNRYKARHADKRALSEYALSLDELAECVADTHSFSGDTSELSRMISDFLYTRSSDERRVFVCRYFYCDTVRDIARRFGFSQSKVKSLLFRTRNKLKEYLESEGINI